MDEVANTVREWLAQERRVVLATVVEPRGSAPHDAGATLAIEESGRLAGSIAGGCVDGAVVSAAEAVFESGASQLLRFDAVGDDDLIAVGLVCGGGITVHIGALDQVDQTFLDAVARGVGAVRCVAIDAAGPGASIVVSETSVGTLGDERVDTWARARASELLSGGTSGIEEGPGSTRVFFGSSRRRPVAFIAGVNSYSGAVATLAQQCGYRVLLCDGRQRFASEAAGVEAEHVIPVDRLDALTSDGTLDERSMVLVCTHDTEVEGAVLAAALRSCAGFIGAMGSRRTHEARLARLRRAGLPAAAIARLKAPVGLDIGAATPAETAVSILAEVIAHRTGRPGLPLGDTTGAIHPG